MQDTKLSTDDTTPAVVFDTVSLTIGKAHILKDISLNIPTNTIMGILGPNGAGKTSLLSLIVGLGKQSSGIISVLGQQLPAKGISLRQQIGVVLQETSLYEELTISENLLFFASLYNVDKPKQRIKEVLKLLGLSDRAHDQARILSGGLKRRAAIARALLHNPKLLVVDEPTLGVDVQTRHAIWEHLRLLRSQGHTILVASNYLDEAQAICDKVSILHEGKLLITDSPDALIARTGHSLDIECTLKSAQKISAAIANKEGIVRSEITSSGLSVFLRSDTITDTVVTNVLQTAPVNGFRFRPADLAEVFQTLELAHSLDTNKEELPSLPIAKNVFARHPIFFTFLGILIGGLLLAEVWLSQPH